MPVENLKGHVVPEQPESLVEGEGGCCSLQDLADALSVPGALAAPPSFKFTPVIALFLLSALAAAAEMPLLTNAALSIYLNGEDGMLNLPPERLEALRQASVDGDKGEEDGEALFQYLAYIVREGELS